METMRLGVRNLTRAVLEVRSYMSVLCFRIFRIISARDNLMYIRIVVLRLLRIEVSELKVGHHGKLFVLLVATTSTCSLSDI